MNDAMSASARPLMKRGVIYSPAWWIPGGHLQTLWGKLFRRQPPAPTVLERWDTPDGDFVELHRLRVDPGAPRLLLLHGLEGTVRSHYAQGLLNEAARRGWGADLLIFRSCGSEMNRTRRFYHSGETTDTAFVLARIAREFPRRPWGWPAFPLEETSCSSTWGKRVATCHPSSRRLLRFRSPSILAGHPGGSTVDFRGSISGSFLALLGERLRKRRLGFLISRRRLESRHFGRWKISTT